MTEHTPGPWLIRMSEGFPRYWYIEDEDGACIASEGTLHGKNVPHMGNAALVSAAPDLLEACRFAVEALGRQTRFYAEDAIIARVVLDIEAAIARATGEPAR